MLNAEQLQRFSLQGYLIFESLITGQRLDWYVSVFDELVERGRALREPEPHFSLELNGDGSPRPGLLHKVQGVCVVEPRILEEPEVLSRGFVDIDESDDLMERTRKQVVASLEGVDHISEWSVVNTRVKDSISRFLYDETHRRPMVLPVSVEV